jgi:hypothetical protein
VTEVEGEVSLSQDASERLPTVPIDETSTTTKVIFDPIDSDDIYVPREYPNPRRLPPELFQVLVENTSSRATMATMCRVSRSLAAVVRPILYRRIHLRVKDDISAWHTFDYLHFTEELTVEVCMTHNVEFRAAVGKLLLQMPNLRFCFVRYVYLDHLRSCQVQLWFVAWRSRRLTALVPSTRNFTCHISPVHLTLS